MSDVISKKEVIDLIWRSEYDLESVNASLLMISDVERLSSDPVVLCKDCRFWQDNNGGYPHKDCHWRDDETPEPEDFCSLGERVKND